MPRRSPKQATHTSNIVYIPPQHPYQHHLQTASEPRPQSPIATTKFGDEVLSRIFWLAGGYPTWLKNTGIMLDRVPWIIYGVCQRWRSVAQNTPSLWNELGIRDSANLIDSPLINQLGRLAKSFPFTLGISGLGTTLNLEGFSRVLLREWDFRNLETLYLYTADQQTYPVFDWTCDIHLPKLAKCIVFGAKVTVSLPVDFFDACTALSELQLINVHLIRDPWAGRMLQTVQSLTWKETVVNKVQFDNTLVCFPMLRQLHLQNVRSNPFTIDRSSKQNSTKSNTDTNTSLKIVLPHLKALALVDSPNDLIQSLDLRYSKSLAAVSIHGEAVVDVMNLGMGNWVSHIVHINLVVRLSPEVYFSAMRRLEVLGVTVANSTAAALRNVLKSLSTPVVPLIGVVPPSVEGSTIGGVDTNGNGNGNGNGDSNQNPHPNGQLLLPNLKQLTLYGDIHIPALDLLAFVQRRREGGDNSLTTVQINKLVLLPPVHEEFEALGVVVLGSDGRVVREASSAAAATVGLEEGLRSGFTLDLEKKNMEMGLERRGDDGGMVVVRLD